MVTFYCQPISKFQVSNQSSTARSCYTGIATEDQDPRSFDSDSSVFFTKVDSTAQGQGESESIDFSVEPIAMVHGCNISLVTFSKINRAKRRDDWKISRPLCYTHQRVRSFFGMV